MNRKIKISRKVREKLGKWLPNELREHPLYGKLKAAIMITSLTLFVITAIYVFCFYTGSKKHPIYGLGVWLMLTIGFIQYIEPGKEGHLAGFILGLFIFGVTLYSIGYACIGIVLISVSIILTIGLCLFIHKINKDITKKIKDQYT